MERCFCETQQMIICWIHCILQSRRLSGRLIRSIHQVRSSVQGQQLSQSFSLDSHNHRIIKKRQVVISLPGHDHSIDKRHKDSLTDRL